MRIDRDALFAALDERRRQLGMLTDTGALPWTAVAEQVGVHSAVFSRMRAGNPPGPETAQRLAIWLGRPVEDFYASEPEAPVEEAVEADHECTECGDDLVAETETLTVTEAPAEPTAAIIGTGRLSDSTDEETIAAVNRVRELLNEGGVGVSIAHDLNPDDLPSQETIDGLVDAEDWDALDAIFENVRARPRHVAIVDTPAFSDARLDVDADGFTVTGPIVFEGPWTGDLRRLPVGSLVWDADLLPIPIIWDRDDGDHTGMTVGVIDSLERVEGVTSALRGPDVTEEQVSAVAAAAGSSLTTLPARLFARFQASAAMPLHVDAPDEHGLRRVWGHVAPRGVCHRSDMGACFQYPGDVDREHRGFHTGFEITLDDGSTIRPGAVTAKGLHIDTRLAKRGVGARELNRHREDITEVVALVRAWEDPHGLAISGVLSADVDRATLLKIMASAPSVELWPSGRGRTLVGIHIVPTPAWPVAASAGTVQTMFNPHGVTVELEEAEFEAVAASAGPDYIESLERIEKALAILVADRLGDIPEPPEPERVNA